MGPISPTGSRAHSNGRDLQSSRAFATYGGVLFESIQITSYATGFPPTYRVFREVEAEEALESPLEATGFFFESWHVHASFLAYAVPSHVFEIEDPGACRSADENDYATAGYRSASCH